MSIETPRTPIKGTQHLLCSVCKEKPVKPILLVNDLHIETNEDESIAKRVAKLACKFDLLFGEERKIYISECHVFCKKCIKKNITICPECNSKFTHVFFVRENQRFYFEKGAVYTYDRIEIN